MQRRLIRILSLIKKEFLSIFKDPKSRALIITPPILQLLVFAHAITMEVKNIDISILDYAKTYESRELISKFSASKWFRNVYFVNTKEELKNDIDFTKSQLGLIIQNDFSRKIKNGNGTDVLIIADGRQTNSASLASGYASVIISNYSNKLTQIKSPQINVVTRNWFNPNVEPGDSYKHAKDNPNYIITPGSDCHVPRDAGLASIMAETLPNDSFELADLLRSRRFIFNVAGSIRIPYSFNYEG